MFCVKQKEYSIILRSWLWSGANEPLHSIHILPVMVFAAILTKFLLCYLQQFLRRSCYAICSNSYQGVGSEAVGQHHALPVDFKHVVLLFHFGRLFYPHPSLVKRLLSPADVLAGDEKVCGREIHMPGLTTVTASNWR